MEPRDLAGAPGDGRPEAQQAAERRQRATPDRSAEPAPGVRAAAEGPPPARTQCCIVGGGPAGAMLGLLLARQGLQVALLEQHHDFDRDFRGDTLHPSTLEILAEVGLAERVLALPHGEVRQGSFIANGETLTVADFSRLPTRFPYIAMLPQAEFLALVVADAQRYPGFKLCMGADVRELIVEEGVVRGVRYDVDRRPHELRATLTVGADGRFSTVRRLAGLEPRRFAQAIDVLWFRVPREHHAPPLALGRIGGGHVLAVLPRHDSWQLGFAIPKGGYKRLRAAGLPALRQVVAALAPELRATLEASLTEWRQVSLLSVEASRVRRWYRPGLLLVGDAAHVMSPVGGVGINYAIQDAVVAANVLGEPLRRGRLGTAPLVRVQLERTLPTVVIQALQNALQARVVSRARQSQFAIPAWLPRVPIIRDLPARLVAFGLWRVHVRPGGGPTREPLARAAG